MNSELFGTFPTSCKQDSDDEDDSVLALELGLQVPFPLVRVEPVVGDVAVAGKSTVNGLSKRVQDGDGILGVCNAIPLPDMLSARIVKAIATAAASCIIIENNGVNAGHSLWTWGSSNKYGILGRRTIQTFESGIEVDTARIPGKVDFGVGNEVLWFHDVTIGGDHMCALTKVGRIFVWGGFRNHQGSFFVDVRIDSPYYYELLKDEEVRAIASTTSALYIILNADSTLYRLGPRETDSCEYETLREDSEVSELDQDNFGLIQVRRFVDQIFGGYGTLFITEDKGSKLFTLGRNSHGQLGRRILSIPGSSTPDPVFDVILKPELVIIKGKILSIACGAEHSLALVQRGDRNHVMACGNGAAGQLANLGLGSSQTFVDCHFFNDKARIESIAAGSHNSFFIGEGIVYGCGKNLHHGLAKADPSNHLVPTVLNGGTDLLDQGYLFGRRVVSVAPGAKHTLFVVNARKTEEVWEKIKKQLSEEQGVLAVAEKERVSRSLSAASQLSREQGEEQIRFNARARAQKRFKVAPK